MQALLLDELSPPQAGVLRLWLEQNTQASALPGTYWLPMPPELLSPEQSAHQAGCGPYCLAIVLEDNALRLELLLRARQTLHCSCVAMAQPRQRQFALAFWDSMLASLENKTNAH